jgi:hypothetical protein
MADRFIGCEVGSDFGRTTMTEGAASTAALDVELRITTDAPGMTKIGALNALDLIKARLEAQTWPPA